RLRTTGEGMLILVGTKEANAEITPSKLTLGESQAGEATRTLTIRSLPGTGKGVTYTFEHEPALATNGVINGPREVINPNDPTAGSASVSFSPSTVTVKNNQAASVNVTINAPSGPDHGVYGGSILT